MLLLLFAGATPSSVLDGVIVATVQSTNPILSVVSTNPVLTVVFTV